MCRLRKIIVIREAIQFHKTISTWFGEGGNPVSEHLAISRAKTCAMCPLNKTKPIWEKLAEPVALLVRRQLALKNKLNLNLGDYEDCLNVCDACNCILKLKVWQPIEFIAGNTKIVEIGQFHERCWIPTELSEYAIEQSYT